MCSSDLRERHPVTPATREFAIEMDKEGASVWQTRQIVGRCRSLGLPVLQSIFKRERDFRTDCQQDTEMIPGKGIRFRPIKSKNAHDAIHAF